MKDKPYTCQSCHTDFKEKDLAHARLENGAIVVTCKQCNHSTVLIEKAECRWPFFSKGPFYISGECKKPPIYILPYKTFDGVQFRCVCSEHIDTQRHIIPIRYIGPEATRIQIEKEIERRHPIKFTFFKTYALFVIIFGPIALLIALSAYIFPTIAGLQFTLMFFLFGIVGYIGKKAEFINIPDNRLKKLRNIWLLILVFLFLIEQIMGRPST